MKLIKQTKLHFREGNSDKVYEADLCEVGDNQYVVNFRYGKRGANLTEGTKTTSPVDLKKAQDTFDKIIKEKTSKGYQDVTEGGEAQAPTEFVRTGDDATDRKNALLWHLELGSSNPAKQRQKRYNIKRAIWRVGELHLAEATPLLLKLFGKGLEREVHLYNYCILWSLGHCAAGCVAELKAAAIAVLEQYANDANGVDMVRRIAMSSLVKLAQGDAKETLRQTLLTRLPDAVRDVVKNPDRLARVLQSYANNKSGTNLACITDVYFLSFLQPELRKAVTETLRVMPMRPNSFKYVRYLFKIAEHQAEPQVWGMAAYKLERETAMYRSSRGRARVGYQRVNVKNELAKPDSRLAYSHKTREKLRSRLRELLETFGKADSADYVKFATGLLLCYSDAADAKPVREDKSWRYNTQTRRYEATIRYYDAYAHADLLNYILFSNSTRYSYVRRAKMWTCDNDYMPNMPAPVQREENFPHLWDKMPMAYVHLIIESQSRPVVEFALRALKQHNDYQQFINKFDLSLIYQLLQHSTNLVAEFALTLLQNRVPAREFSEQTIMALLASPHRVLREYALICIKENADIYYINTELIKNFLLHALPEVRLWVQTNWDSIVATWNEDKRRVFLARMISYFMQLPADSKLNLHVRELADLLQKTFTQELKVLSVDVLGDLLNHSLLECKLFAARLFANHQLEAARLPIAHIRTMLVSNEVLLRQLGQGLLQRFADADLAKNNELLCAVAVLQYSDTSQAIRPLIQRAAAAYEEAGQKMVEKLLPTLLKKETWEGVHQAVYNILTLELEKFLHIIHRDLIFRLLNVDYRKAQELACILIERYIPAQTLTMRSIIRLADHEILNARELAWNMFRNDVARVKYEREEAIRLLDAKWDDSRNFAIEFFRANFTESDWTPELLVSICDSVRTDIQALGTELITRFFAEENGVEYLLKLSQHPRPRVQLYATNYLQRFASDNLQNLQKLELYFITVLSQVNKVRVAKDRIFDFLHAEALKTSEAAHLVADIVSRISATCAIGDKATCIEIMRDIQARYPHVETIAKLVEIAE